MKILCVLFALCVSFAFAEVPRVAVSVTAKADSEQWQNVLTVELSKLPDMQIVERAEYAQLLREREEMALRNTSERQLAALPNIAYYVHFRETSESNFIVEIVSAENGKLLASTLVKNGHLDDAPKMAVSLQALLKTAVSKNSAERMSRIAVIEPVANEQAFILGAQLRDALATGGFTVLDRALTQEVVIERNEADRGQRDAVPDNAFLGVDFFLQLVLVDGDRCELRLVNSVNNQLVAMQTFVNDGSEVINKIQSWLFPLLGVPEKNLLPYSPSASVEALQPFYRGLKLFDEGKYIEATSDFTRAYTLETSFKSAYEWEARCYDALAMPQLADAVRRYQLLYVGIRGNVASPEVSEPLAFLGIHGDDAPELCTKLSALTANALATRRNVNFPESLAQTCREYDWLVGLGNTDGNRWENSPSLFCRTTVSGRLAVVDGKPVIRWFLRDTFDGKFDATAELPLSANSDEWPAQIEKFFDTWLSNIPHRGTEAQRSTEKGGPVAGNLDRWKEQSLLLLHPMGMRLSVGNDVNKSWHSIGMPLSLVASLRDAETEGTMLSTESAIPTGCLRDNHPFFRRRAPLLSSTLCVPLYLCASVRNIHSEVSQSSPADIPKLEAALRQASGLDVNVALLRLALADPANLLIGACSFEKNMGNRSGIETFLNCALRDYCIGKLAEGDPSRRWFELMQIYMVIGYDAFGRIVFGEKHEFVDLLEKFVAANGKDAPGLVARYSLIFDTQGTMPYPELIKQCDALLADLRGLDAKAFPDAFKLQRYTESIRSLACIANGETSLDFWTDTNDGSQKPAPHCIRLKWYGNQKQPSLQTYTRWYTNDMHYVPLTPEEKMREAQAAIAFNGRGNFTMVARDEWLEKWPRSLTLTTIARRSLEMLDWMPGMPQHPFDGEAQVASYRRQVDYLADNITFWLGRIEQANKLQDFERDAIKGFISVLNSPMLFELVSDEQCADLQRRIVESFHAAEARVGRVSDTSDPLYISWQAVTRTQARKLYDNVTGSMYFGKLWDRDYLRKQVDAAEAATADAQDHHFKNWWDTLRGREMRSAFSETEIAEMTMHQYAQALARVERENLTREEWGYLFEQALLLLRGGRTREAEVLFEKLQNAPAVKTFPDDILTATLQANIAYRLVHIYRANGRLPEALQQMQLGLKWCENKNIFMLFRQYDENWQKGHDAHNITFYNIARKLVAGLQVLRHDPNQTKLPERVYMVTVTTPQMDNPTMNIYYRVPLGAEPGKPCRVLVTSTSLEPNTEWARFADEHNLVLVSPQFHGSEKNWRTNDPYCISIAAQVWSGQALLDGLDKIAEQCPIQKDKLMFHTSGFPVRFARWRPDLVAAIALTRPGNGTPSNFYEPGLHPLSALRDTAIYVVGAEVDNKRRSAWHDDYEEAVLFATLAQAAGMVVEWKNYPDLTPPDPQEVDNGVREFFAKQLTRK